MQINPFIRPLPKVITRAATPPPSQATASVSQKIGRGMAGSERAASIKALASDIQSRTARVEHLRIMAQKMEREIKNNPVQGSSRIAELARGLNKDF